MPHRAVFPVFQSTRRLRSTRASTTSARRSRTWFNPRPGKRGDASDKGNSFHNAVSIHVPTRGGLNTASSSTTEIEVFQAIFARP